MRADEVNYSGTVAAVKADLERRGVDLSGPAGAFAIISRVAWVHRSEGAGLLDKPGGNNWNGYATDIICFPDGSIADCLVDGGGANGPAWQVGQPVDPARYRPAIDPGDGPVPPGDPPPPQTDVSAALRLLLNGMQDEARQLSVIEGRLAALELAVTKLVPPAVPLPSLWTARVDQKLILGPFTVTLKAEK